MRKILFLVPTLLVATPVLAADICTDHPKDQWMTKEQITTLATGQGYEIKGVKEEDGCWEVKGMKDGTRVEAYFDPVSGDLVKTK
ncbi:PepSY domain-containing protein [Cereibacter azotoformans]|uniref:PepSY domain-containing protein n=1 Tax=Cereibacter azotoformans TaxID=43057 RepID=UPI000C6E5FE7|nr:PepSY domain-containing protein [Cereibacter azotoformans]